ncbi:MAG: ABC transporter ATP-binding protein [Planctomycetes bacterium]|nr:ABC transporter ATP-binding protein [Planctomycetota bacterium]MBL7007808.1 ABC transporter ATP-binding protein [Planctomycetota bacterium]
MSVPAIRCDGLSRWYGEVQGLSGLSLTIEGGVVGLLGPNGSGKSTFMKLLTGLIRPSRGYVEVFGRRVGPDSHRLFSRIGYSPGEDVHFEGERAIDFLALLARFGGDAPAAAVRRGHQAMEKVGLPEKAEVRLNAMSKGMRQRVKVAQALLFEPELLLLDEPLNGMDPISRRATMRLVREHGERGGTVVFASHVLHEVEAVTSHVVLLHHGRLLAEGRLGEIRELVDRRPRRLRVDCDDPRLVAATLLDEELACGTRFEGDARLELETRTLAPLLARIEELGAAGRIHGLDLEDEGLEGIFDLLVGGDG